MFFQMSQLDGVMYEYVSDDDDFEIAYAALELMDDSRANKSRTISAMPGIVWAEIQLTDRDKNEEVSFSSSP
jgi:hypothetical protein